jgi:hypothetical protein
MTLIGKTCRKCGDFYLVADSPHCLLCGEDEPNKSSVMYPPQYINVFGAHTTEHITGKPIRVRGAREQTLMCEDHGCAPYDDFKETNRKAQEKHLRIHTEARQLIKETEAGFLQPDVA